MNGRMRRAIVGEAGASAVELAIALPLLAIVIVGVAQLILAYMGFHRAGIAADRLAVIAAELPAAGSEAQSAIADELAALPGIAQRMLHSSDWAHAALRIRSVERRPSGVAALSWVEVGGVSCPAQDVATSIGSSLALNERAVLVEVCVESPLLTSAELFKARARRVLRSSQPMPLACAELHAAGERQDGLYRLDPDGLGPGEPVSAWCNMSAAGGGWTLVAAQFEADPMTSWDEGIQPDYDPTLSTGRSFSWAAGQIPPHAQTAFGNGLDPLAFGRFEFTYTTGALGPVVRNELDSGNPHRIHRAPDLSYPDGDSDQPGQTVNSDWFDALLVDPTPGAAFGWWYQPRVAIAAERGAALHADRRGQADTAAWTVWVR